MNAFLSREEKLDKRRLEKVVSSDETMVVIQSACKIQTWGKK